MLLIYMYLNHLGVLLNYRWSGLAPRVPDSGVGTKVYISKFPDDTANGPGTTL